VPRRTESGGGGHNAKVTVERQREPAADAVSLDGCDDRLVDAPRLRDRFALILGVLAQDAAGQVALDTGAGAERTIALAGDDDRPDIIVAYDVVVGLDELRRHLAVDGIARLGVVEHDRRDVIAYSVVNLTHDAAPSVHARASLHCQD
jgi:hypothetical protein